MTLDDFLREWNSDSPTLHVHTSGSTGKPKEMWVEKQRMLASARMTCDMLGLKQGDTALLCMPLDYIAGKMMVVRSIERGMQLIDVEPSSHPLRTLVGTKQKIDFAAFVPLQVIKTLENEQETEVFRHIKNVLIGGGSIDEQLEATLKEFPNHIYSTYGMTETLSHIALRPISGKEASLWYTPCPNVSIGISEEGTLTITAPSLIAETLITNDIAELNTKGLFRILGRKDNTINTGGIKVQIEEIECQLNLLKLTNCQITTVPDSVFGEAIVLLISEHCNADINSAIAALPKYWKPRHIIRVSQLPFTETGKPNRAVAKALASQMLQQYDYLQRLLS